MRVATGVADLQYAAELLPRRDCFLLGAGIKKAALKTHAPLLAQAGMLRQRDAFRHIAQWLWPGTSASVLTRRDYCERSKPPADWYKRGAWIDPAVIERRMVDDVDSLESPAAAKEPETAVTRQLKALIRVSSPWRTHNQYTQTVRRAE